MVGPVHWIKQQRPGWEFWVALPITFATLVPLAIFVKTFFQPNLGLGGVLLLILIPLFALIVSGFMYMQYKLALHSFAAYIFAALLVPNGYYIILIPGTSYDTTTIRNVTYYNDASKIYKHVGNWSIVLFVALSVAYFISAIKVKRIMRSQIKSD